MERFTIFFVMSYITWLVVVLVLAFADSSQLDKIYVHGQQFVDNSGRVRIFHGFNSVLKSAPWFDEQILNKTRLAQLRDWGFNVVRLGTMWSGAEPMNGAYNRTYIGILVSIVNQLADYGIYTVLDMHQDVLTSAFGGYDGIPRWLFDSFPSAPMPYPWPFKNMSGEYWGNAYLTLAVGFAFQNFYNNYAGAIDSCAKFWQTIATAFNSSTNLLGYELINEPWAGDIYADPSLLFPGVAGRKNLVEMYERISAAIRKVDQDAMIFYEPVTWAVFFTRNYSSKFDSGFDHVPGGIAYQNRSVFSYHYYCWILSEDPSETYLPWKRVLCDDLLGPRVMPNVIEEVSTIGGGLFLTEFGDCAPDNNPLSINTIECDFVLSEADKYLQSWTYWDSDFFDATTGEPRWNSVLAFARVYARAVAGALHVANFNLRKQAFHLEFELDPNIVESTEIFVPHLQFPKGFNVTLTRGLMWKFDAQTSILSVMNSDIKAAQNVSVDIYSAFY